MERAFSQTSRNFPVQALFKSSKGSKGSKSKSPSKEPIKKGSRLHSKKKGSHRSTTPVLQNKLPLCNIKPVRAEKAKGPSAKGYSSRENNVTNKLFAKPNKSDELESIEKEKVEFSTFSIEQDIANLAHIKGIGTQGDHFVFDFEESEEQLAQFRSKTSETPDGLKLTNVPKKQPTQVKAYLKPMPTIETRQGRAKGKSMSPTPSDKEMQNKKMIMEYIQTVKNKISFMDK